jgi:predicted acylesterase/phospholipase RssA
MKPVLITIGGGGMPQLENALGAIRAIQEIDLVYHFDELMGTSAGAIVASVFASLDQNLNAVEEIIRKSTPEDWFVLKKWQAIKSIFGRSNYVADNTGLKNFLLETINKKSVDTVKVAVTSMGKYGKPPVVGDTLMLPATARAVLASMSFQHIFPPVVWGGTQYGDGGVFNLIPLPKYKELQNYDHIYIIIAAQAPLFPSIKRWPFLSEVLNVIDRTMEREVAQIHELALDEAPNITVIQPPAWEKSSNFLKWSNNFEQIEASYKYAYNLLKEKRN